jgi:hypothetical protein
MPAQGPPAAGPTESSLAIALVHGTFAPGAPWTQPGSALRRLWPATPERPVTFDAPQWSGDNSHEARVTAAAELASHLRKRPAQLVIAHSHGGNVALNALASNADSRTRALVCLNTPFLHCQPRSLVPLWAVLIVLNPLGLLFLSATPFLELYMFPRYPGQYWRPVLITAGLLMAAMIPVGVAGFAFFRLSERLTSAIEMYQERRSARLRASADPGCHILAATVKQDEAYRYLWLLDRLTDVTSLGAGISYLLCVGGVALIVLAGSGGFLTDFNWFPGLTKAALTTARYGAIAAAAGAVLFLVSAIVTGGISAVVRGHKFSYGEQIVDSLLLRISVEPYPPHPLKADLRYFAATAGGLKHSALYGSPEVVQSLAAWFYELPVEKTA